MNYVAFDTITLTTANFSCCTTISTTSTDPYPPSPATASATTASLSTDHTSKSMMLELSYITVLPFPVYVAILGSLIISIGVFLKGFFNMTPPELPALYFRDSSLNTHIIAKCKLRDRYFSPNFWLSSRHVQTVLPIILPRPEVTYEREYLQMRDKGVVAMDWVVNPHVKMKRKTPVLLVIPPLAEGALHVSSICHTATTRGMKAVVFNRRGDGGSVLTTPKLQSFGDPSDLRQVIKYIKLRLPKSPIAAVAYGTGCGLLMSYLGEFGSSALLTVGACISPCYDAPLRFSSRLSNVYDLLLMLRLKSLLCHHGKALTQVMDVDRAMSAWTFSEYNQSVYCPLYGYSDLEQFWEMNNPIRDVDDIEVPVLCVNSLDDPVCACTDIPYDLFKCYPNFLLVVTSKGGHCGFLDGFPPKSWSDSLCLDYVESVIEFTTKVNQQHRPRYHSVSSGSHHGSTSGRGSTSANPSTQLHTGVTSSHSRSRCSSLSRKRSTERFTI